MNFAVAFLLPGDYTGIGPRLRYRHLVEETRNKYNFRVVKSDKEAKGEAGR